MPKTRKSNAGAKPIDVVVMCKILVLQQLNNLSDAKIEYQIRDQLSFIRFLGLEFESRVPNSKARRAFRERLKDLNLVEELFGKFHEQLARLGYVAKSGQNPYMRILEYGKKSGLNLRSRGRGFQSVQKSIRSCMETVTFQNDAR